MMRRNAYGCLLDDRGRIAHPGVVFPVDGGVPGVVPDAGLPQAEEGVWVPTKRVADRLCVACPVAAARMREAGVRGRFVGRCMGWYEEDVVRFLREGGYGDGV